MRLLDGRALATEIRRQLKEEIAEKNLKPGLAVLLVGNDTASHLYVSLKEKACREAGIVFFRREFAATAHPTEILKAIQQLNNDSTVHGILVQLPLPPQFKADEIIQAIDPAKDADGFHSETLKRFSQGDESASPGLVSAIFTLIQSSGEPLQGKEAVVLANSLVFAQPLLAAFKHQGATGSYLAGTDAWHTPVKNADVLIVAVGKPGVVHDTQCKPGAMVIDVGTNRVGEKVVGDVAVSEPSPLGWLSPVPGGVGPMTVACLLQRVVRLASR